MLLSNSWVRRHLTAGAVKVTASKLKPPVARRSPHKVYFGVNPLKKDEYRGNKPMDPPIIREDPYFWLRDDERKNPEVIKYLKAENAYCDQETAHLKPFQQELYQEMISHMQETDEAVPYQQGTYFYYTRTLAGKAYTIHCRKKINSQEEEIILDENGLAQGHEYSDVGSVEISRSHRYLAYAIDNTGDETYTIQIKSLIPGDGVYGTILEDKIEETSGEIIWLDSEDRAFLYTTLDEEHRPEKVWLHTVGTPQSQDVCLFTEEDRRFFVDISLSQDEAYLFLSTESKETSEVYYLPIPKSSVAAITIQASDFICLAKRRHGLRYECEHHSGYFYFITNLHNCKNNVLMRIPTQEYSSLAAVEDPTSHWQTVRAYSSQEQIDGILPLERYIAILGRSQGYATLWIMDPSKASTGTEDVFQQISFPEQDFDVSIGDNYLYHTSTLRVIYTSFLQPRQVMDIDLVTNIRTILKTQPVPGYERDLYECRRFEVTASAKDTVTGKPFKIPCSMVYRKDCLRSVADVSGGSGVKVVAAEEGSAIGSVGTLNRLPVLLYGYGSYGVCVDPSFDFKRLSLLDRGVLYIIAHIRGGGELGHGCYEEQGKYFTKMNTFSDFGDVIKSLLAQQMTTVNQLAIVGRSAGGLLVGAAVNQYPSLMKAAIADVPFVDVMNSMCDPSIPLTVTEWEEWGNPNEDNYHDYMLKYSPYDNVPDSPSTEQLAKMQPYPAMLITGGLHDPRVAYWEPAKWTAKLRTIQAARSAQAAAAFKAASKEEGKEVDKVTALVEKNRPLLLKTDLSAGHFSASDRYKYIEMTAFETAFILDQIGAKTLLTPPPVGTAAKKK